MADRTRVHAECEELFGRSLFFVGEFGVNDYLFSFGKMSLEDIRSVVVPSIIETTIRQAIEVLLQISTDLSYCTRYLLI